MVIEQKKRYAKVAHLALRIHLNTQAMLSNLSRQISPVGKVGSRMNLELYMKALNDLESSFDEFENLTEINMFSAKTKLGHSLSALERKDLSLLYELIQELYREDFLGVLMETSK